MEVQSLVFICVVATLHTALANPLDCSVNPCANGGTCVQTNDGNACQCPPRVTGTMCENKDFSVCPPEFLTYAGQKYTDAGVCIGYIMPWCNRTAASGICRRAGGKLIVLSNQAKYDAFKQYGEQYHGTGFWVDAAKNERDGKWYWSDNTEIDSTSLTDTTTPGQPGDKCLLLAWNGSYYVINCNTRNFLALCEAEIL